jgi:hypothetical protein
MNWRRGLLRVWTVLSLAWIIIIAARTDFSLALLELSRPSRADIAAADAKRQVAENACFDAKMRAAHVADEKDCFEALLGKKALNEIDTKQCDLAMKQAMVDCPGSDTPEPEMTRDDGKEILERFAARAFGWPVFLGALSMGLLWSAGGFARPN